MDNFTRLSTNRDKSGKMEREVVSQTFRLEHRGMQYAFAITIILALIGAFLIFTGSGAEGLAAILVPLSLHIFNYLIHRGKQDSEVRPSHSTSPEN